MLAKIAICAGANDVYPHQSDVCKLVKVISDAVVFSGPENTGYVASSRLLSVNCWMSIWCYKNNVGFIDNCTTFKGNSDCLGQANIDLTQEDATLISCTKFIVL